MTWQKNGTPDTLGSAGDTMTISDLTKLQFNQILEHDLTDGGGNVQPVLRVGDGSVDSGANYANVRSENGGALATNTNDNQLYTDNQFTNQDGFIVSFICAISGEELLAITFRNARSTAGAGSSPFRVESAGKWVTTTQIDNVSSVNINSGSFDTDSNLSVLGTN